MFETLSFRGGLRLPLDKDPTANLKIETLPRPPRVIIHLAQHAGTPANPLVKHGDRVRIGQVIAEPTGAVSLPVHASVSGTIISVGLFPTLRATT